MPVRSGLEAVEEIQRREPGLAVILMGAFLEPADVPRAEALGAAFLTKPFELARMRALVRALVATPTARAADLMDAAGRSLRTSVEAPRGRGPRGAASRRPLRERRS